jgi:hypothetical protein
MKFKGGLNLYMDWSNIIPTLLGTLTGGFITWIVTRRTLKKQFEFEKEINKLNRLRMTLKALTAIKTEMIHNKMECYILLKSLEDEGISMVSLEEGKVTNFMNKKWIEFNQELANFNLVGFEIEKTSVLEKFYSIITHEINNSTSSKKRLEALTIYSKNGIKDLEKNIK